MLPRIPLLLAVSLSLSSYAPAAGQVLHEQQRIHSSDEGLGDLFGMSVSISGGRALIGAPLVDGADTDTGAAYVFERTPGGWVEEAKLTASDAAYGDYFGWSVALDGDRALVGALLRTGAVPQSGAAYVFERTPKGWVQVAELLPPGGVVGLFGSSVALDGDRALVGAIRDGERGAESGAAYVYLRRPLGWDLEAKLYAVEEGAGDQFGYSVSLDGDRALVGARFAKGSAVHSGAAYLFQRGSGGWSEVAALAAFDGKKDDEFGDGVSLEGERALVGAYKNEAAYVFERVSGSWVESAELRVAGLPSGFGNAVALDGDRALVSASRDPGMSTAAGAVYLFDHGAAGWSQTAELAPSYVTASTYFGNSVALEGDHALVGNFESNVGGISTAYAYALTAASCASRSGVLGLDPPDCSCASAPRLGKSWQATIATAPLLGTTTLGTVLTIGLGGPTEGTQVFGFELLLLPPFGPVQASAGGSHFLSIPFDSSLVGLEVSAQGARLEAGGGKRFVVLTNALDLVLGL